MHDPYLRWKSKQSWSMAAQCAMCNVRPEACIAGQPASHQAGEIHLHLDVHMARCGAMVKPIEGIVQLVET